MLKALAAALTSRAAGPIAAVAALALAVVLAVCASGWQAQRAGYERRIADLTRQSERSQALMRAQLAACHAATGDPQRLTETGYAGARDGAQGLLERRPQGIDACARMESADEAVLSNLK